MAYVIFEKVARTARNSMLTITNLGRLNFNTAAADMLRKKGIQEVLLLWDKDGRRIAIQSITKKDSRSYMVRFSRRDKSAAFAARPFLECIRYDYSHTKAFPCEWNEEQHMFEVSLPADAFKPSSSVDKPQPQRFPRLARGQKAEDEGAKEAVSAAV